MYSWTDDDFRRLLQSGSSGVVDPEKYPALWPLRCLSRIEIVKISACGGVAAAVSRAGQLFTWYTHFTWSPVSHTYSLAFGQLCRFVQSLLNFGSVSFCGMSKVTASSHVPCIFLLASV